MQNYTSTVLIFRTYGTAAPLHHRNIVSLFNYPTKLGKAISMEEAISSYFLLLTKFTLCTLW